MEFSYAFFFVFLVCTLLNIVSECFPNEQKTFIFPKDININIQSHKKDYLPKQNKNDVSKISENYEQEKKSNSSIKNAVDTTINVVKKKTHMDELPTSQFSDEEVEEAKEDSEFLSNDLEEAAENFASSEQNDNAEEKNAETKNIKKYQAEIVNSMNSTSPYKIFDSYEMEKVEQIIDDSGDICDQDYSLPCPLNFFRTSSGCVPLNSYDGPCNKIQDKLIHLYDNQKESWGEICKTNWPCMPTECPYGTDYNATCPIDWIDVGNGICKSLYEKKKCFYDVDFSNMTIKEKKNFEKECNVRWRCKSINYKTNFTNTCPFNWVQVDTYKCKAPSDYIGPCPKVSNLKKYNTEELKKVIENTCFVNWPYTITVNDYQRDYTASCPIGWSLIKNGMCKAPDNYQKSLKCNDEISFVNMNPQQKETYSFACNVDFPFKDKEHCKRNYSFECPLGWIPSTKKGFCKAPVSYKSRLCKNFSKFKNLSDYHKNYYSKSCGIDWPCEGEIQNSMIYTKLSVEYIDDKKTNRYDSGPVNSQTGLINYFRK